MDMEKLSYPRPDFIRKNWVDLNGEWKFKFDDADEGESRAWYRGMKDTMNICVPFCYQSDAAGISDKGMHEILWYEKEVFIEEKEIETNVLLHFGGVDYEAVIWVNGCAAGSHRGGNCHFHIDITKYVIRGGLNRITLKAVDRPECVQPRGKQYWNVKGERIWYPPTSGIWKSVWLEYTGKIQIEKVLMTPDIDRRCVTAEVTLNSYEREKEYMLALEVCYAGKTVKKIIQSLPDRISRFTIDLAEEDYVDEIHYWTPEAPKLYDVDFELKQEGHMMDRVGCYFGMRKISIKGNRILLNNKPYYQRLVLDQGYWRETLMTPPDAEALKTDILMTRKMGFNGARKHQKVEDARYYYLADTLGLLVWGELPSAYQFCSEEIENIAGEWMEFIQEEFNHPCIITWVPLNESWGVRNIIKDTQQQAMAKMLYHMTKAFDPSRIISNNDGWELIEESDICGIHDYTADGAAFAGKFSAPEEIMEGAAERRMVFAEGSRYRGKPVLLTEYGGIAFSDKAEQGWGYYEPVKDEQDFFRRFEDITMAVRKNKLFQGYCYTQLTDVFQEANGLLAFDRTPKINTERMYMINHQI